MHSPTFTVIVPTYGRPQFLPDAVRSVLAQSVGNFECLVVDDASPAPVDVPVDPRVRVIRRSTNGGPAAARNSGIAEARGECIVFLDDDDLFTPDRLEIARDGLERQPVAICHARHLDEIAGRNRSLEGDVGSTILDDTTPHCGATAIRREAIEPFDEGFRACEDVDWWLRTAQRHRVTTEPREGVLIRRHDGPRHHVGTDARLDGSRRLLEVHAQYFAAHRRATRVPLEADRDAGALRRRPGDRAAGLRAIDAHRPTCENRCRPGPGAGARRSRLERRPAAGGDVMLSVVLPLFNGADTLELQLASLAAQDYDGAWELVIADNGSEDASLDIARAWSERLPGLRIVDAADRRGCAAADNIGAAAARGSVIAFCDQDDVVQPGWLASMASALEAHDLVVGANDFAILDAGASTDERQVRRRGDQPSRDFYDFLPWGLSCNLGVSAQAFRSVGGFDEQLRGGDDVDLCWRIQLAGFPLHREPAAVVAKRRRSTARDVWDQHFNYGVYDVTLFRKHGRHGMPRRLGRGMRRWAWLGVHLPDLGRADRRNSWVRVAAGQSGRLVGSLRQRALYL